MDIQNSISAASDDHRARVERQQAEADDRAKRETPRIGKPATYFLYRDGAMENAYTSATEALAGLKNEPVASRQQVYIGDDTGARYAEKEPQTRIGSTGYTVPDDARITATPEFEQDLAHEAAIRERDGIKPEVQKPDQELARQDKAPEHRPEAITDYDAGDDISQEQEDAARDLQEERQMQEFEERENQKSAKREEAFTVVVDQMNKIGGFYGRHLLNGSLEPDYYDDIDGVDFEDVHEHLSSDQLALVEEAFESPAEFYSYRADKLQAITERLTLEAEAEEKLRPGTLGQALAELRDVSEKFDALRTQMQQRDPQAWEAKLDAALKATPVPQASQRQAWETKLDQPAAAPSQPIAQALAPWQQQLNASATAREGQPQTPEAERQAQQQAHRQTQLETPGR